MASTMPYRIDVHSHYLPPFYQEALRTHGHANPDGMPYLPDWSVEEHLDLMQKCNISKSILSISSPGTNLVSGNDELARNLARDVNKYAADVKKRMPDKFGYFASLPLPDVEAALAEIPRAVEEGCDGFVFETNYHGHYVGDKLFDPIFDELNRRGSIVFIHPTTPMCACSPGGGGPINAAPFEGRIPQPTFEFFFDTARVIINLFLYGTMARCPNLKIIIPHCAGAFPPLLSRFTAFSAMHQPQAYDSISEAQVRETLQKQFWFDLAGVPFPGQIRGLIDGVGVVPSRLLYGTDYAFARPPGVQILSKQMDVGVKELFSDEEIEDIYHRNAEKLLLISSEVSSQKIDSK